MNEISRKEVATMLSKIKYCHNYNSCNYSCKYEKQIPILVKEDDERMDYVIATMKEHKLQPKDLLRLLIAYRDKFVRKEEDEDSLIGKLKEICIMFDFDNTYLPLFSQDTCSVV